MAMTPRERWLALLAGQTPDRVPTDYRGTHEVTSRLMRELDCPTEQALWRRLHIDKAKEFELPWEPATDRTAPDIDRIDSKDMDDLTEPDMWGVRYQRVSYGTGAYDEPAYHPLARVDRVEQVHAHPWPEPDDFNYEALADALAADDGYYPIKAGIYEPFLLYGYMRGLERAYEDLALRPGIADAIFGRLFDFHYEVNRRIFEASRGRIDITGVAEDLGSQSGPLISLAMYRRFFRANQRKMADLARSFGIHILYHTDGAARLFLPDLIDVVGIDILDPIQWRCPGMERETLVRDFGDRIIFHGSIDNQHTLAFGCVDDVIGEIRDSLRIYGNTRWICAPCHNIQPVSPTQNIVAMYEAMHEMGKT